MKAFATQVAASPGHRPDLPGRRLQRLHPRGPAAGAVRRPATPTWAARFDPAEQTYSFNGLEGSLDHVLASPAARAMVTGADVWQINAQEAVAYAYSRYNYNATLLFNGDRPVRGLRPRPGRRRAEPAGDPAPAWSASTIYNGGDLVTYNGLHLAGAVVDAEPDARATRTGRGSRSPPRRTAPRSGPRPASSTPATSSSTRARSTSPSGGPATRRPVSPTVPGRPCPDRPLVLTVR